MDFEIKNFDERNLENEFWLIKGSAILRLKSSGLLVSKNAKGRTIPPDMKLIFPFFSIN